MAPPFFHRPRHCAVFATLLLAACSGEPEARPAGGDSASAGAATTAAPSTEAPAPQSGDTEPIRDARDITAHEWREVERDADGEWIVPAPGLAIAFPADDPPGGPAADDPADPARSFEIYPNHRVTADGRPLAESATLSIGDVRVEDGGAVLALRESWRRRAEPEDALGTREVRVRVTPVAGASGVYRWDFSYASPDPCAGVQPCVLARPLWVGTLGTRHFERPDPAEDHPLDQTEPSDAPIPGGG